MPDVLRARLAVNAMSCSGLFIGHSNLLWPPNNPAFYPNFKACPHGVFGQWTPLNQYDGPPWVLLNVDLCMDGSEASTFAMQGNEGQTFSSHVGCISPFLDMFWRFLPSFATFGLLLIISGHFLLPFGAISGCCFFWHSSTFFKTFFLAFFFVILARFCGFFLVYFDHF